MRAINLVLPFSPVRTKWLRLMFIAQAGIAIAVWAISGSKTLPSPGEVASAWWDLVQKQGLLFELWASVKVSIVALLVSTTAAVTLACLSTAPVFMPIARMSAAMRFLGFAGLTYVFMLASSDSIFWLRVSILSFGMFVFMVTSLLAEIEAIPRDQIDHCRTLGMQHWRITSEILLGKTDVILDFMRQNAAVGWTLLTLVEGMTRSEGGIGATLLNQNRYFLLAGVFAIQITILSYGLGQDYLLSMLKDSLCPYSGLGKERGLA